MTATKVYFICPDDNSPVGGVKVLYRHTDILNKHGINASILHFETGFRCSWFRNETVISYFKQVSFHDSDIIVFPETLLLYFSDTGNPGPAGLFLKRLIAKNKSKYYANALSKLPNRKVIFNQNAYYTLQKLDYTRKMDWSFAAKNIVATLCVSQDNLEYLQKAFRDVPIFRVRLSIDEPFEYQPSKKASIAFLVNKGKDDINQVIQILRFRNALDGYDLVPIRHKTEEQVSRIFKEALMMLHFGHTEGFPLPPAEAMLCGSIVVGYHGRGGRESFNTAFSYPVEVGDIPAFVDNVEKVIALHKSDPKKLMEMGREASDFIARHYNAKNEQEDVVSVWSGILAMANSSTV